MIKFKYFVLIPFLMAGVNCYAGDLDDGIGIDEPINDDINLDKNVQFIIRKSLAKGKTDSKAGGGQAGSCGSGNIVIGAGSNVREVINVSTNKGTTAVCGK